MDPQEAVPLVAQVQVALDLDRVAGCDGSVVVLLGRVVDLVVR